MKFKSTLLLLMCLASQAWGEVVIQFEPRAYLYSQVRDKIEHDTPYDIELPYVDTARQKKFMPSTLNLNECLNWIIAYFEKENDLTLNYQINEHRIIFQKASSLSDKEQKLILSKQLSLQGKAWSLSDAIQSASQQSGIPILMPFKDQKMLKADYNYKCSLGEFIEEIKLYWLNEMGYRIHAIIEKEEITFYKGGALLRKVSKPNTLLPNLDKKPSANQNKEEN